MSASASPVLLCDLDGTLLDSAPGIVRCLQLTFREMGVAEPPRGDWSALIGPPLVELFERAGLDAAGVMSAIGRYRFHYRDSGLIEYSVYPGIPEMLASLASAGFRMAVATAKLEAYAEVVLGHAGLAEYFEVISGIDELAGRTTKRQVMASALERLPGHSLGATWMIGDREHDADGASHHRLPFLAALWGYGRTDEFESFPVDFSAPQPRAAADWLLDRR